jgi:hypothetical protein
MDEGGSNVQASSAVSIEECVFKIRAEADRIMLKYETGDGGEVADGKEKAQNLAERMRKVGVSLLERAAFTAVTDPQGRIRSINGAFESLLSPPGSTQAATEPQRKANKQAWEQVLASAPLGSSTISNPISDPSISPGLKELSLRRTAMEDDPAGSVRAYLNALRGKHARGVPPSLLQELDSLLPELSLHASFFTYDTGPRLGEHLQKLEELTGQLEQLTEAKT